MEVLRGAGDSSYYPDPSRLDPAERIALRKSLECIKQLQPKLQTMIRINYATM